MALAEGKGPVTSSYIESVPLLFSARFVSCRSRPACVFAAFLLAMTITITIIVMETTILILKSVARTLVDIMYARQESEL